MFVESGHLTPDGIETNGRMFGRTLATAFSIAALGASTRCIIVAADGLIARLGRRSIDRQTLWPSTPVDVTPISYSNNCDYQIAVKNFVKDPKVSLPNAILVVAAQLLDSEWARLTGESADALDDATTIFFGNRRELFRCALCDEDVIECHAASCRGPGPRTTFVALWHGRESSSGLLRLQLMNGVPQC